MQFPFSCDKLFSENEQKRSEMMLRKTNYHTHTERCYHAWGSDEEFVLAAIKGGYTELGFSDHACWKYDSDFVAHMRMPLSAYDDYYDFDSTSSGSIISPYFGNSLKCNRGYPA